MSKLKKIILSITLFVGCLVVGLLIFSINNGKTLASPSVGVVKNIKGSNPSANKAKLTWQKATGSTGYVIYQRNSSKHYVKVGKTRQTSYTVKSLKPGTYYFKIKGFTTKNSKTYYGKLSDTVKVTVKNPIQWKVVSSNRYCYVNDKKSTGLKKISGRTYYFSSTGIQRVGWQQINSKYYYFGKTFGKTGYMRSNTTISGIKLDASGAALQTNANKKKLQVLVLANQVIEKITKTEQAKEVKLRAAFDYAIKNFTYGGSQSFLSNTGWEVDYAYMVLSGGQGVCFSYGAAFAYMAAAIGYTDAYAVSSGGHGWAEVGGLVYDPDWQMADSAHSYFGMSYDMSGKEGIPNYAICKYFMAKIS